MSRTAVTSTLAVAALCLTGCTAGDPPGGAGSATGATGRGPVTSGATSAAGTPAPAPLPTSGDPGPYTPKGATFSALPTSPPPASGRPRGEWVVRFEEALYAGYKATPSRYVSLGRGLWGVWVNEVRTGRVPYVTVDERTGAYHG